jgi:protein involved in polysaccharide export with SLBB domain
MRAMPAAVVLLTLLAGVPAAWAQQANSAFAERYRIQQGDSVDLIFPLAPTLNRTVTVQPDGYIALPLVGEIVVAGQTVPELEATLRGRYAPILRDPVITIALKDFEKPYFIASGDVERPGKYELRGKTTVAEAVAMAGGLKERARRSRILLYRETSTGDVDVTELDFKRMLDRGQLERDLIVAPGDLIFVPRSRVPGAATISPLLSILPWLIRPW